ncbi:MAG: hypothetical protein MR966_02905 [Lachnospiraceae bacterium]|nr:hypothetical protein [Lachnospiraceae bacterium]
MYDLAFPRVRGFSGKKQTAWKKQRDTFLSEKRMTTETKYRLIGFAVTLLFSMLMIIHPAFAEEAYESEVSDLLEKVVKAITFIFQGVGLVNLVWGAGALILAFRADNGEAQNGATLRAIAGLVLIFLPYIIKAFGLFDLIGGSSLSVK